MLASHVDHNMPLDTAVKRASLLALPPELRLSIYEATLPLLAEVAVTGSLSDIPGQQTRRSVFDGTMALRCCCRTIYRELQAISAEIENTHYKLLSLSRGELMQWLDSFGQPQVARMRRITLGDWAPCKSGLYKDFHFINHGTLEEHMETQSHAAHSNCLSKDEQPGTRHWMKSLGYCWREIKIDIRHLEQDLVRDRVVERWRESIPEANANSKAFGWVPWTLSEAIDEYLSEGDYIKMSECLTGSGTRNERCSKGRRGDVMLYKDYLLDDDGKLDLTPDFISNIHASLPSGRDGLPWIRAKDLQIWRAYCRDVAKD